MKNDNPNIINKDYIDYYESIHITVISRIIYEKIYGINLNINYEES